METELRSLEGIDSINTYPSERKWRSHTIFSCFWVRFRVCSLNTFLCERAYHPAIHPVRERCS